MKKIIFILSLSLLFAYSAYAETTSKFKEYNLKYGVALKLPSHWELLNSSIKNQIDTEVEALTSQEQGDNEILILARHYTVYETPSATARLSIRLRPTFSQSEFKKIKNDELQLDAKEEKKFIEKNLEKVGNLKIKDFVRTKEEINGLVAEKTEYTLILPEGLNKKVLIYVFHLGDRRVKLTMDYNINEKLVYQSTIDSIKNSLCIKNQNAEKTDTTNKNKLSAPAALPLWSNLIQLQKTHITEGNFFVNLSNPQRKETPIKYYDKNLFNYEYTTYFQKYDIVYIANYFDGSYIKNAEKKENGFTFTTDKDDLNMCIESTRVFLQQKFGESVKLNWARNILYDKFPGKEVEYQFYAGSEKYKYKVRFYVVNHQTYSVHCIFPEKYEEISQYETFLNSFNLAKPLK